MGSRLRPEALARAASRHPWRTVAVWAVLILAGAFASSAFLADALTSQIGFTSRPDSVRAQELVEQRLRGPEQDTELVIVRSASRSVDDPAFRSRVAQLQGDIAGLGTDVVQRVGSVYQLEDPSLVSRDRHATLLPVVMAGTPEQAADHIGTVRGVLDRADGNDGFEVLLAGQGALNEDFNTIAEEDLRQGETIGIVVALVVLVAVFGAIVAALLPIGLAVLAIAAAIGMVAVIGLVFDFSFFVTNMITMMGLAVTIDYSLFIVSRFREERRAGHAKLQAIELAGATANRAVLFSGMIVVLALVGMLLIPTTIFRSLAAGAILVVIAAVAASLTLLPALLGLLGDRVNALRVRRRSALERERRGGIWVAISRAAMRRPVLSLLAAVAFLVIASTSVFDLRTGSAGVSTLPDDFASKRAFTVLATEFSGGLTTPVQVVVDGRADDQGVRQGVERLRALLAADRGFGPSTVEVNDARDLSVVSASVTGDPSGPEAVDAVTRIREDYVPEAFPAGTPAEVLVGGETAFNKDFFDLTDTYTPIVFGFVLLLSLLLLTVVFRSIVVPVKSILLNLLSVGAAYGILVAVFQKGGPAVGRSIADLLGFQQVDAIEAWLPLFLFSVLFGLSMDYHVFLLSRIREHYDRTGDNTESVAEGVRTTARLITGAALIMVAVFGGFAAGRLVSFQQMGFGLAVAVLIDATIIRSVLVPAAMKLLGDWNWYLPSWLRWLPKLTVEAPRPVPVPAEPPELEPVGARDRA
ncbi:MAG TPA: MMPL family transporter [Actinomycetota bacterium]|nr:MMPL family transporter [Actinomycetota bacterium]